MRPFTILTVFALSFELAASSLNRMSGSRRHQTDLGQAELEAIAQEREEYAAQQAIYKQCLDDCKTENKKNRSVFKNNEVDCYKKCNHLSPRKGYPSARTNPPTISYPQTNRGGK